MNRFKPLVMLIALFLIGCGEPEKPTIALHLAIERGDINQIERHIQWGSDINKININGETPLHVAATQGSYIVVKLLVEKGANIDILDQAGISPVGRAVLNGRTQIAEYLVNHGAKHNPDQLLDLVIHAGVKDRDIIPLLIKLGAHINHQNEAGQSPLSLAVANSNRVLIKHLIESGADVNLADKSNTRPLAIAKQRGEEDIIRLLERNGAQ